LSAMVSRFSVAVSLGIQSKMFDVLTKSNSDEAGASIIGVLANES